MRSNPGEPWMACIARALVFSGVTLAAAGPAWALAEAELRAHVELLASDELEGRATGEPGCERAAEYIAERFEAWGLEVPPGHDEYLLEYVLRRTDFDRRRSRGTLHTGERSLYGQLGRDFRPFGFSGAGSFDTDVVFAGYGITAPELGHDDYAGVDVRDKLVLVLRYEPGRDDPDSPFDGTQHSRHAWFERKARNAREHGALGMLLVTGPLHGHADEELGTRPRMGLASPKPADEFPAVHVSQDWASAMLEPLGIDLKTLHEEVEAGLHPSQVALQARLELDLAYGDGAQSLRAANVAAFLPGQDPELRDEWIVVGAHYDHIGTTDSGRDRIYNGADDNASGTAVLLALARHWAESAVPPQRSILFVAFSGEERGLLGSRALLEQEMVPRDKIRFMINFDMVGRNPRSRLRVFGDGVASGLRDIVEAANAEPSLRLRFHGRTIPRNSDHSSFYRHDIPILGFFTGLHDDYHSVRDHADKLDYGRMVRIAALGSGVIERLEGLDSVDFPRFLPGGFLGIQHAQVTSAERRRLRLASDEGVLVQRVLGSSPASAAGLMDGDILVRIEGEPVHSDNVVERVGDIGAGNEVEIELLRAGEPHRFRVTLARRPNG